jgi:colanic acid/amylovoran biosynthesis protein
MAMLGVAVARLRELWPAATLQVITSAPERVARHCGEVETAPARGRSLLLQEHLLGPLWRLLPSRLRAELDRKEDGWRLRWPGAYAASLRLKARLRGRDGRDAARFLDALRRADLVVVNGSGIFTDAFKPKALAILTTLDLALRRGTPVALFAQGLGPLRDPELVRRAREVLPRVLQIAVREPLRALPLLAELGVDPALVVVTGDDAIELAFPEPPRGAAASSRKIGVNVRAAAYADLEQGTLATLKLALAAAARAHQAGLVPIPISHQSGLDVDTLRELLGGAGEGGASLDTPRKVIARVAECRVMVSGSYHGAVFALAQGIPVVALARSPYYVAKMEGLAHQFGPGCELVRLDGEELPARLLAAIARAWTDADRLRAPLLARAADQVKTGRGASARLREAYARLSAERAPRPRARSAARASTNAAPPTLP